MTKSLFAPVAAALIAGLCSSLQAADFPEPILPEGVGVNIHFTRGHEKDLDLIKAAGFKFIRMDFGWSSIERKKGEYDWTAYDELTANLEKRGLRALYILDYSNGLYEDTVTERDSRSGQERKTTASPRKPESVAAFARWAGAAAARYKNRRIIWEIWNEPNISFWKPKPNVTDYIALAKATCQAIRAADPQATIVAPASSGFPWPFFEAMFKAGLLEQLDAVSVHPYRGYNRPPESAHEDYLELRTMIERYAPPHKKRLPILSGEWGYATHDKGLPIETQAAFIVRQQLANLLHGVPLSIWYDWKNDGTDPAYNEHNFGTVTHDLQPKPAYETMKVMTRALEGYRIARRLDLGNEKDYVLLCADGTGNQKLAVWTLDKDHDASVRIDLTAADVAIVSGKGAAMPVRVENGQLRLTLGALPQYVTMKKPSRPLLIEGAWRFQSPPLRGIQAGVPTAIQVPIQIRNPFPFPISAEAVLEGPGLSPAPPQTVRLTPVFSPNVTLMAGVSRRDQPEVRATLKVRFFNEADKKVLGESKETLSFRLTNPLEIAVAPVEQGQQVMIRAEGGFSGTLVSGNERQPVAVSAPDNRVVVNLRGTAGALRLLDASGNLVAETASPQFEALAVSGYRARLDGDAKVPAKASVEPSTPPAGDSPFKRIFALDYEFAEGWRFVRCEAEAPKPIEFAKRPSALGLWLYSDNSGNVLRMRVRDASGQTFQPNGPDLDWSGWRWVTFDLKDLNKAGRWGGADDGVVKGNLTLDTVFLVDSARKKTAGRLLFAGPTLIYSE